MSCMKEDALRSLGLNEKQANVYLASLRLGPAVVQDIAAQARMNRTSTYDLLHGLERLGFVSYTLTGGKRHYQALAPKSLLGIVREKELLVKKALPELDAIAESVVKKPKIEVYVGYNGIKSLFEDILRNATTLYSISSKKGLVKLFKFAFPHFVDERIRKGIKAKLILDDAPLASDAEYRILKRPLKIAMWFYNERLVLISLEEREPVGVLIHEKNFYHMQKILFDILWDSLPEK